MNRSQFSSSVAPGLFAFMSSSFKERPSFWDKVTTVKSSRRAYEESAYYAGLGLLPEKPEGEGIAYDDFIQGPKSLIGLLKRNFEVIKRAISGKILSLQG